MHVLRALLFCIVITACGENTTAPPAAPTATASLEVPPLPPPKSSADKPAARHVPAAAPEEDDESALLPRDAAAAEMAFLDAKRAMAAGDHAKARGLLLRSYRLDPAIGTLITLAMTEERLGMKDEAIKHYQMAYDGSLRDGRTERAKLAKDRLDALKNAP